MSTTVVIKNNTYFDSVSLMSISTQANQIEGVQQAFVAMATDMNKEVLNNLNLLTPEIENAGNGDLMIIIQGPSEAENAEILTQIEALFTKKKTTSAHEVEYVTIDSAKEDIPEANLTIISVNGHFAAREARKALNSDMNVMLFSDNVSIEEELELKQLAHKKGLLMMGPDCGTAIINNIGLCFANKVRPGHVGIIGASGTGSQEISVRIHDFGGGISQLIGTGGRDLSEGIGGIMMLDALKALNKDENTQVIVLVSKPPAPSVEAKILAEIKHCQKPVVVCFIGGADESVVTNAGGHFAKTTKEAALKAVLLSGIKEEDIDLHSLNLPLIEEVRAKLKPEQKYIRGLFCGGTLCDEAMYLAKEKFQNVYSNIQLDPKYLLKESDASIDHTFLDFGSDGFTDGKPHPMIDPSNRIERFLKEAKDPEVGVIILDFIVGYGSHEDPVGVMLPAIIEAKKMAQKEGRHLEILGYVLGTDLDEPNVKSQFQKLLDAGVTDASSCTNAALLARGFVTKGE
ncbi:acyl-CoA synthetase FdrA [Ignatzschineria sp. LJL83]